ncbi:hypothetical protein Btru_049308 [Bulinus truncatus]|nr:hypothetical protein Btru_049308 [Bulinus truncatus]
MPTPSGQLEVVFSFDTTGSMYSWLEEIRGRIQDMIQRLQADIPGIRIAVMAHGDYCDTDTYVTKWIDFTTDVVKLCDFVRTVEKTGGGDAPECYELVLRQVRTDLSWTPGSRRVLVLIGDDKPHEPNEACNKDKIDWRAETKALALAGVTIYGTQCGNNQSDLFYKTISVATGGKHLRLEDFGSLFDTLMAVCYRESNDTAMLTNYEKEVRARCGANGLALDIDAIFASLRNETNDVINASIISAGLGKRKLSVKKVNTFSSMRSIKSAKKLVKPLPTIKPKTITRKPKELKSIISKTSFNKYKLNNLPLLRRENVPEVNFKFNFLSWTPWAMCSAGSKDVFRNSKSNWQPRNDNFGFRLKQLPITLSTQRPWTVIELSVQINGPRSKRYVMFSKCSNKCWDTLNWEEDLLNEVKEQIDRVLLSGCKVYIRYCLLSDTKKKQFLKDIQRYDYAWGCQDTKNTNRDTKNTNIDTKNTNIDTKNNNIDTKNTNRDTQNTNRVTKNTNRDTKNTNRDTKNTNIDTKNTNRDTKNTNIDTKNTNIDTKNTNIDTKNTNRDTKNTNRDTKNTNRDTKNTNRDTKNTNIDTKNTNRDTKNTNRDTKNTNRDTKNTNRDTKNTNRDTKNTNINTKNTNRDTKNTNIDTKNTNRDTKNTNIDTKNTNRDTKNTNIDTKNTNRDTKNTNIDIKNTNRHSKNCPALILDLFISDLL